MRKVYIEPTNNGCALFGTEMHFSSMFELVRSIPITRLFCECGLWFIEVDEEVFCSKILGR